MNDQLHLFSHPDNSNNQDSTKKGGKPRLVTACRDQYELRPSTLDELLPKNHLARDIWKYVVSLDLSLVLEKIQAVEGTVGRSATDPKIILSIWLLGTLKSISSSRVLEEYCNEHDAFKWLCGGVNVSYHTISTFRTEHRDQLDDLLTQSIAVLAKNSIISLERVAQDGMRVRANAGSSSFRRKQTLKDHLQLATLLVSDLKEEAEKNPNACRNRLAAAERRAAEEKVQKIESALKELAIIREKKKSTLNESERRLKI